MELEIEKETKARRPGEERPRVSHQVEMYDFSVKLIALRSDGVDSSENEVRRKLDDLQMETEGRSATTITRRVNTAGVCALSRRLMAIEWARVLRRQPVDLRGYALEQAGREWAEERARRK